MACDSLTALAPLQPLFLLATVACFGFAYRRLYQTDCAPGEACAVVFDPDSLAEPKPGGLNRTMQRWHCKATRARVMFTCGPQRLAWEF